MSPTHELYTRRPDAPNWTPSGNFGHIEIDARTGTISFTIEDMVLYRPDTSYQWRKVPRDRVEDVRRDRGDPREREAASRALFEKLDAV